MSEREETSMTPEEAAKDFLEGYRLAVDMLGLRQYERKRLSSCAEEALERCGERITGDESYWRMRLYEVEAVLDSMRNGRDKLILYYRYVRGMSVERAASLLGVSRRTGYRLHARGLSRVALLLKKR